MILTWFLRAPVACRIASGIALVLLTIPCFGQEQGSQTQVKPAPAHKDVPYGPHKQTLFDLWQAKSDKPTPLPIRVPGGGFIGGSKGQISPAVLKELLAAGIAVAPTATRTVSWATTRSTRRQHSHASRRFNARYSSSRALRRV